MNMEPWPKWYGKSRRPREQRLSMIRIGRGVAKATGVAVPDLKGICRKKRFVEARHIAFFIASQQGFSTPQIGRFFCRDHSTVLHGISACRDRMNASKDHFALIVQCMEEAERAASF